MFFVAAGKTLGKTLVRYYNMQYALHNRYFLQLSIQHPFELHIIPGYQEFLHPVGFVLVYPQITPVDWPTLTRLGRPSIARDPTNTTVYYLHIPSFNKSITSCDPMDAGIFDNQGAMTHFSSISI